MRKVELNAFDVVDISLVLMTMKTALSQVKAIEKNYEKKVNGLMELLQKAYKSQLSAKEMGIVSEQIMDAYDVEIK